MLFHFPMGLKETNFPESYQLRYCARIDHLRHSESHHCDDNVRKGDVLSTGMGFVSCSDGLFWTHHTPHGLQKKLACFYWLNCILMSGHCMFTQEMFTQAFEIIFHLKQIFLYRILIIFRVVNLIFSDDKVLIGISFTFVPNCMFLLSHLNITESVSVQCSPTEILNMRHSKCNHIYKLLICRFRSAMLSHNILLHKQPCAVSRLPPKNRATTFAHSRSIGC